MQTETTYDTEADFLTWAHSTEGELWMFRADVSEKRRAVALAGGHPFPSTDRYTGPVGYMGIGGVYYAMSPEQALSYAEHKHPEGYPYYLFAGLKPPEDTYRHLHEDDRPSTTPVTEDQYHPRVCNVGSRSTTGPEFVKAGTMGQLYTPAGFKLIEIVSRSVPKIEALARGASNQVDVRCGGADNKAADKAAGIVVDVAGGIQSQALDLKDATLGHDLDVQKGVEHNAEQAQQGASKRADEPRGYFGTVVGVTAGTAVAVKDQAHNEVDAVVGQGHGATQHKVGQAEQVGADLL